VAIVTGDASGIGRAAGARLADAGFRTVMTDVDPSGRKVTAAIERAVFVEHDVTDAPAWERVIETTLQAHDRPDVLVNNAAVSLVRPLTETTFEEWRAARSRTNTITASFFSASVTDMQPGGSSRSTTERSCRTATAWPDSIWRLVATDAIRR
jgi:NAD(P)-dependent dehydrogenase (short-subunit alcohol dehydrogenase family)